MNSRKSLNRWISFLCAISLILSFGSIPGFAVTANAVTATTNATVKQGNTAYAYVYIDSTESLSALDVSVHFDPAKVKITGVYNKASCTLYDCVTNTDNVQFSYIFDGKGSASKTQLFYFTYQVLSDAEVGNAYFDITIGEAYDNSLNDVAVSGSRCGFAIAETVTSKSCSVYGSSSVSTSVQKEFSLNYRFSTNGIASGSAVIIYDPELFEVMEVSKGSFLNGKVVDINTALTGSIYLSFVGTTTNAYYDLITVRFKTLKNVSESSKISFQATELCDSKLNLFSCQGYTTTAQVTFDASYTGDAPKMALSADFDEEKRQVTAVISLEENAKLGAGDFVLRFDSDILTLSSYEKGLEADFFTVNDKEVADGILKFSIISTEDITSQETVLTLVFDAKTDCQQQSVLLDLDGNMLVDSLTNTIALNFIDATVQLPSTHSYGAWEWEGDRHWKRCSLCGDVSQEDSHSYDDQLDVHCNVCEYERSLILPGDVNGDCEINGADSILLLQYLAEWEVEVDPIGADCNGDKEINGADSIVLLQYLAEWDVSLG